jgi:TatD DNase family protein
VIDAHAHLDDPRLVDDLDGVIARAVAAGITRVLSCGEDLATSRRTAGIAERYPIVRVAIGVHPHRAATWSDDVAADLVSLAKDERVVAIGEIGVDLSGRSAPRETQERAFTAQLELARALDLPVVVHIRDAGALAREIVDRVPGSRGMIHCFSEGPAEVDEWVRRGFAISFAGTVTYPKNATLREAAARVPHDALLVETDAPYLAPQRRRGQRNEPAYATETLAALSAARSEPLDRTAQAVSDAARRLFSPRWR